MVALQPIDNRASCYGALVGGNLTAVKRHAFTGIDVQADS